MDLLQETEDYIRESINHSVGLPVPSDTLVRKLRAIESAHFELRHRYLSLQSKLKEKDDVIERSRAEASMNAVALKKFVEENQKLAAECSNLVESCKKWERECSLYENDRDALMDFANEADERAKEAEIRNCELEEEKRSLMEELRLYKSRAEGQVGMSVNDMQEEQMLLDSLLATMFAKSELPSAGLGFLEAHNGNDACQKLLKIWTSLRPLTQKVIDLAAEVKNMEKDKDQLMINLHRAEEEVNVLYQENNILDEENKRLLRLCSGVKHFAGSGGKHTSSSSGKGKRKCSPKLSSSPVEKKIDFGDADMQRQPLSPLELNSPESRIHKT